MYLEVRTGRGRMDILILHNQRKYIVETKIWGGDTRYAAGKAQLAAYVGLEAAVAGSDVVCDTRDAGASFQLTDFRCLSSTRIRLMRNCLLRISEVVAINVDDLKGNTLTLRR